MPAPSRYELVDAVLIPWAKRNHLYIASHLKDEEVRSLLITAPGGTGTCQLWITPEGESVVIGLSLLRGHRSEQFTATLARLESALDSALAQARVWLAG